MRVNWIIAGMLLAGSAHGSEEPVVVPAPPGWQSVAPGDPPRAGVAAAMLEESRMPGTILCVVDPDATAAIVARRFSGRQPMADFSPA
jgi:hypothetical protein